MFHQILYLLPQLVVPVVGTALIVACFVSLFSMRPAGRPKAVLVDKSTGDKIAINMYETSLGRAKTSDIVVPGSMVSRSHAVISRRKKGWFISDTNSKVGTFVNGEPVAKRTQIFDGDEIMVANSVYTFVAPNAQREGEQTQVAPHKSTEQYALVDGATGEVFPIPDFVLDIGRSENNDIVISDPRVSRYHASIRHTHEGWFVVDRDSAAGVGLNGYRVVDKEPLSVGDTVQVLNHKFTFTKRKAGGRRG